MLKRKLTNHRGVMLVRAFLMIEKDEPQIAVARMIPPAAKAFWVVVLLVILVRPSVLMLLLVISIYTDKYLLFGIVLSMLFIYLFKAIISRR